MDLTFLLRGVVLGFAIAAPVGPIGVICIRRTLSDGRLVGFVSGLGAATADMSYGAVAAFGLTAVATLLTSLRLWIHLAGGFFLLYLGIKTLLAGPAVAVTVPSAKGVSGVYGSTLALTLANPATILSFVAVFAGLGVAGPRADFLSAALITLGVFAGSAMWWLILSTSVNLLRSRLTPKALRWVNRLSGGILMAFAVYALVSAAV